MLGLLVSPLWKHEFKMIKLIVIHSIAGHWPSLHWNYFLFWLHIFCLGKSKRNECRRVSVLDILKNSTSRCFYVLYTQWIYSILRAKPTHTRARAHAIWNSNYKNKNIEVKLIKVVKCRLRSRLSHFNDDTNHGTFFFNIASSSSSFSQFDSRHNIWNCASKWKKRKDNRLFWRRLYVSN